MPAWSNKEYYLLPAHFLGNHLAVYIEWHLMGYGIAYLTLKSISLLCFITHLLAHTCSSLLLALKHQEIASVKHSFIIQVPVYCENRFIY